MGWAACWPELAAQPMWTVSSQASYVLRRQDTWTSRSARLRHLGQTSYYKSLFLALTSLDCQKEACQLARGVPCVPGGRRGDHPARAGNGQATGRQRAATGSNGQQRAATGRQLARKIKKQNKKFPRKKNVVTKKGAR